MESMSTNTSGSDEQEHCLVPASVAYPVITINSLASLLGTFGNILVWVAVIKNTRLQTLTNYFLLSLAFADVLVTGVTQPLFVVRNIFTARDQCIAATSMAYRIPALLSCMASILNLTAVSIDRLISLKYPLQKQTILPKRRGFSIIAGTWILACSYMALSFYLKESMTWAIMTFAYFAICYLTMIITHWHMYIVSHRFIKRRNIQTRRYSFSMVSYTKDREAAKTITIIIAVFTLTWLPFGCGIGLSVARGMVFDRTLGYPLFTVGLLNSCINPVLYSWRNKEFRTTFCQLLKCQDPNLMRRESVSSFYIARSRISTCTSVLSDNTGQCYDKNDQSNSKKLSVITNCEFPL